MFTRHQLRSTSLLALIALLWGLLFPTLANAGIGEANAVWTEVCTAQGIQKIKQGNEVAAAEHQGSAAHCLLCCLGGSVPDVAPAFVPASVVLEPLVLALPPLQFVFPPQLVLLTAPPRAPPVLSF